MEKVKKIGQYVLLALLLVMIVLVSGCRTAQERVDRLFNKHPDLAVKECNERWPTKAIDSTTVIDSVKRALNTNWQHYIDSLEKMAQKGSNVVVLPDSGAYKDCKKEYDKVVSENKGLRDAIAKLRRDYKPCLPDTVYKTKTVRVLDMKPVQIVKDSLSKERDIRVKAESKVESLTKQINWLIGAVLILGGLIALRLLKKI